MSTAARKRFEEFDIGRAVAILGLPIVHVLEEYDAGGFLAPGVADTFYVLLALAAFGAPLFMACLGANIVFSRKSTAATLAKRGLLLLFFGALLNVARFGLPDAIFGTITGYYDLLSNGDFLNILLSSDIYDFAGMCFLAFALFTYLKMTPRQIFATAVVLLICGAYVLPYFFADPEVTPLSAFLGRFFYMNANSWFPLTTWLIFPASGYLLGSWYRDATESERQAMVKKLALGGAEVLITTTCVILALGGDPILVYATPANDYITDIPCVLMQLSTLAIVFPLFRMIALRLQGTKALEKIVWLSSCIMPYYVSQWILVGWSEVFLSDFGFGDTQMIGMAGFLAISITFIVGSILMAKAWDTFKKKRRQARAQAA